MKKQIPRIFNSLFMFMLFAFYLMGTVHASSKNQKKFFSFLTKLKKSKYVKVSHKKATYHGTARCDTKYRRTRKLEKAFLHAYNLTCWSCPKGYKRSIDPNVAGKRACVKPASS